MIPCSNCEAENSNYRCTTCNQVAYCSSDCLRMHWDKHKSECTATTSPSTDSNNNQALKKIKTVIVHGMEAVSNSISITELEQGKWEKCQVPAMLGEPLMVRVLGYPKTKPSNEIGIFLMVDPVSGLAAPKWQMQVGQVEFARCDNRDLDVQTFWDLYSYIYTLMDYYPDMEDFTSFKSRHLIPKAYQRYRDYEHQIQGLARV